VLPEAAVGAAEPPVSGVPAVLPEAAVATAEPAVFGGGCFFGAKMLKSVSANGVSFLKRNVSDLRARIREITDDLPMPDFATGIRCRAAFQQRTRESTSNSPRNGKLNAKDTRELSISKLNNVRPLCLTALRKLPARSVSD
jgi:hypothetical protein